MLLAMNVGNTHITFGGYAPDGKLAFCSQLYADANLSADELTYKLVNMLALYGVAPQDITDVALSSVVPALTPRVRQALAQFCEAPVLLVGPGLAGGVVQRLRAPEQLGGELLCAVVGALERYRPPLVVLNLDTATTLLAVDGSGALVGAAILPGPQLALTALIRNTAQLPQVALETLPAHVLGADTAESLQSGIVYGTAAQLDGMLAQFRAALEAPAAPAVATGQLPASVRAVCQSELHYHETLILDGLYALWRRHKKRGER